MGGIWDPMEENDYYSNRGGLLVQRFFTITFIFLFIIGSQRVSYAGEWVVEPSLSISESYDDNVRLRGRGDEENDYITQVNPGISIQGRGNNAEVRLDYVMQNIYYQKNSESNATYQAATADLKSEILKDFFYIDADASYRQQNIDQQSAAAGDNISIDATRTDVSTYSVNPYVLHDFGNTASMRLQHNRSETDYKDETLLQSDSLITTNSLDLMSGTAFHKLTWHLHYEKRRTEYASGQSEILREDKSATIRLLFSRKTYLIVTGGYEENDYEVPLGVEVPKGSYWSGGLGWQPTHRTKLEVTKGERFYGDTAGLSFSHQTRRSMWDVNYSEDIMTTSELELLPQYSDTKNQDGQVIYRIPLDPLLVSNPQVIINKSFNATASIKTRRSDVSLSLHSSKRIYQQTQQAERVRAVSLSWRWLFKPKTYLTMSENIVNTHVRDTTQENNVWRSSLGVEQLFSQKMKLSFNWHKTELKSTEPSIEYERNLYVLAAQMTF